MALSLSGPWGRRITRLALLLGMLLLIAAPVLRFWVTPVLAQSPEIPGDGGFLTHVSTGTITTLFDLETSEGNAATEAIPVTRTESTRGDAAGAQEAQAAGANAAVTNTTDRLVTDDGRVVADTSYRLAADRQTQALVDCCDVQVGGVTVPMAGAGSPLRLPWFVPEKAYPYFDLTLLAPVEMTYIGHEDVNGIEAAKFQQATSPTPIGAVDVPGALVGAQEPVPLVRTHVVNRTLWVDPTTGIILRKVERIRDALRDSNGKEVVTLLAMTTSSTPEQVRAQVEAARAEGRPVLWAHSYGPLLALLIGLLLVILGATGIVVRTRAARAEEDFPDALASFDDLRDAFD